MARPSWNAAGILSGALPDAPCGKWISSSRNEIRELEESPTMKSRWASVPSENELVVSSAGEAYDAQARNLKRCGEEFTSTERRRKCQRRKARRSRARAEKENKSNYRANCISGRWWRGMQASDYSRQPPSAFARVRSSFGERVPPWLWPFRFSPHISAN